MARMRLHCSKSMRPCLGNVIRYEALARLELADGRMVSPGVFLPLLGDAELQQLFVLTADMALSTLTRWDSSDMRTAISVNAAPTTIIHPDFPRWVDEALKRHQVAPDRLVIEVLESHQVDDAEVQRHAMDRLQDMGVGLAMDDLGSGYSSLVRLMDNPFDTFKVDAGVLKNIYEQPIETLILIDTMIRLGKDLGRVVVMEGLEDRGMLEAVMSLGARYGQGYVLARPMEVERAIEWNRTFRFPLQAGEVETVLGALAYQWKTAHGTPYRHHGDLDACPITQVLEGMGASDSAVGVWHHALHRDDDALEPMDQLTRWLAARIQRPG